MRTTKDPDGDLPARADTRSGRAGLAWAIALGVLLGAGAVGVDLLPDDARPYFYPLLSTGLAWGAGAVLAGALAAQRLSGAVGGVVTLLLATWVYYGAILIFGLRPDAGSASVLRAASIWTAVALAGGAACGLAGWWAVRGGGVARSVSTGLIGGILGAQGVFELVRSAPYIWQPNARAVLVTTLVLVMVPVLILAGRRRSVSLRIAVPTAVVAMAVGAIAWGAVLTVLR